MCWARRSCAVDGHAHTRLSQGPAAPSSQRDRCHGDGAGSVADDGLEVRSRWVVGGSFGDQRPSANSARGAESWFSGSVYFCQSSQPSTAHRPLIRLQAQAARTAEKTWRLWCPLNRCLVYLKAFRWEPRRFHGGARPPPHGNSCQTGICVIPKTHFSTGTPSFL